MHFSVLRRHFASIVQVDDRSQDTGQHYVANGRATCALTFVAYAIVDFVGVRLEIGTREVHDGQRI